MLSLGSVLVGKYQILSVIGQGGYGLVYRGHDIAMDRDVAIKELLQDPSAQSPDQWREYQARFRKEAQVLSQFSHQHVVTAYALEQDATRNLYLVLEYVEGGSLAQRLANECPMSVEQSVDVGIDLCKAIEAIYSRDIVHRDIKPSNILLTRDGHAKLTDFGVAQVGHETRRTQEALGHPGTPAYKSPEQATSTGYLDERSDLYAVGLVLYEMLSGRPYVRDRMNPRHYNSQVPVALDAIIMRALETNPARRFQTARDMQRDLERVRDESTVGQLRIVSRGITPARLAATAGLVAFLLVVGGVYRLGQALSARTPQSRSPAVARTLDSAVGTKPADATWTPVPVARLVPTPSVSLTPAPVIVPRLGLGDPYEPDDDDPAPIDVGDTQLRVFDPQGDVDRVTFRVKAGRSYSVLVANPAPGVDPRLEVQVGDALYTNDDAEPGTLAAQTRFAASEDGVAVVTVANDGAFGPDASYELSVTYAQLEATLVPGVVITETLVGSVTPRATFTPRPTLTFYPTLTGTATRTRTITPTRTESATASPTATGTETLTSTPSPTATDTLTPLPSYTPLPTRTATFTTVPPTITATPNRTPLPVRTNAPPTK